MCVFVSGAKSTGGYIMLVCVFCFSDTLAVQVVGTSEIDIKFPNKLSLSRALCLSLSHARSLSFSLFVCVCMREQERERRDREKETARKRGKESERDQGGASRRVFDIDVHVAIHEIAHHFETSVNRCKMHGCRSVLRRHRHRHRQTRTAMQQQTQTDTETDTLRHTPWDRNCACNYSSSRDKHQHHCYVYGP